MLFSQYSWWDFIKLILVLAIPYYAYVLWTYYREDIREWMGNRGQPKPSPADAETDDEEPLASPIFTVNTYASTPESESISIVSQSNREPEPTSGEWLPAATTQPANETDASEMELQGPAVNSQSESLFGLPLGLEAENPAEQSIDELIQVASRIRATEEGVITATEPDDKPAARLAALINNQQGKAAFADISFTR